LVALLALAGCGDRSTAEVSGAVKVDGKPVKPGAILFISGGRKDADLGGEIKEGRYPCACPRRHEGVHSVPEVVGTKKIYDTPEQPGDSPITKEGLPARYNEQSELQLEVKPGKNPKDWD